jgi:hypothetical protein
VLRLRGTSHTFCITDGNTIALLDAESKFRGGIARHSARQGHLPGALDFGLTGSTLAPSAATSLRPLRIVGQLIDDA